jgi:hypothetical protein
MRGSRFALAERPMRRRNFTRSGMKYGALAGFVCAELFIICLAAVYSLMFGPATGITTFLFGQVIGALPATLLGAVLGGCGGLLFAAFPTMRARGLLWGVLCALGMYLLLAGLLRLFWGRYLTQDYEFFFFLFDYITSPSRPAPEHLFSYVSVFVLYLCAGAWVGSKLEKLAQEQGQE